MTKKPTAKPASSNGTVCFASMPTPTASPDEQPQPLVAGAQQANDQKRNERPQGDVVDGRSFESADRAATAGCDAERGERLGEPAPAELPRHPGGEHDADADQERGNQAQAEERVAEGNPVECGDEHRDRRLVDVAEGEVMRRFEEVELVSVVAVTRRDREQQRDGGARDRQDRDCREVGDPIVPLTNLRTAAGDLRHHATSSGGEGDRTLYLLHAMQALYQLSYAPEGTPTLSVRFPARRCEIEAVGGERGRHRAADERPVASAPRRLPRVRGHDQLWSFAVREIGAEHRGEDAAGGRGRMVDRRAEIVMPDLDRVDAMPLRHFAGLQEEVDRAAGTTRC